MNGNIKVVHVVDGIPKKETSNGVLYSLYFLSKCESRGITVEIWCTSTQMAPGSYYLDNKIVCRVLPRNIVTFTLSVIRLIKGLDPKEHIFHFHGVFSVRYWVLGWILENLNFKYVVSPHGSLRINALARKKVKKKFFYTFWSSFVCHSSKIRALTFREESEIVSLLHTVNTTVIPNGISCGDLISLKTYSNLVDVYKNKTFVYIGRLDIHHKGLDILVEAARDIDGLKLRIIGPTTTKKDYEILLNLINEFDLANRVELVGPLYGKDKVLELSKAYFFVQPSRYEGMPISVLEALCLGVPVIVSSEVGLDRDVQRNHAGFVVKPHVRSLVEALIRAVNLSFEEWVEMRLRAEELAVQYSWGEIAEKTTKMYWEILHV